MGTAAVDLKPPKPNSISPTRQRAWVVALLAPLVLGPVWVSLWSSYPAGKVGTWSGLILLLLAGVCAYTDLRWKKIPNWATYPAFLWALGLNVAVSVLSGNAVLVEEGTLVSALGGVGITSSLMGAGVCFFLMLMIYRLAGGGAGDVKLATAIGALVGPEHGLTVLIYTYIVAGAAVLCWIIWKMGPIIIIKALLRKAGSLLFPTRIAPPSGDQQKLLNQPVPLAAFFAIGATLVLVGWTMQW